MMQLIPFISTDSALRRMRLELETIDALRLPGSARPHVETILVRRVAKMIDQALPWQRGHGRRTAALAEAIGSAIGLCQEALHHLRLAALLHDIGLLSLPGGLHAHADSLDREWHAAVQCHPRAGAEWLEPFRFLKHASVIIAHHHERWDGSGYPYGIRGSFIPLEARILAIADAFDAIRVPGATDQETRAGIAYRILTVAAGTQFDPHLVEICGQCLPRQTPIFPID
jgi:HD-GYP domain-containing protein (c-di-GMP phosphodiesterase class II)